MQKGLSSPLGKSQKKLKKEDGVNRERHTKGDWGGKTETWWTYTGKAAFFGRKKDKGSTFKGTP